MRTRRALGRLGIAALAAACAMLCACGAAKKPLPPPEPPKAKSISDAEKDLEERVRQVVVGERGRLRACYEEGLAQKPDLAGRVVLVLEVGQNGMATRVFEARREGLGDDEIRCFARVLKSTHFHDGAARSVRIQVPLAFAAREPEPPR